MYYLEKVGVYGHGVFGVFDDLKAAKKAADIAASGDKDDYHAWVVYKAPTFKSGFDNDAQNECVYTGIRTVEI